MASTSMVRCIGSGDLVKHFCNTVNVHEREEAGSPQISLEAEGPGQAEPTGLQNKVMTRHLSEIDPPGSLYLPACLEEKPAALPVTAAVHGAVRSADFCLQD